MTEDWLDQLVSAMRIDKYTIWNYDIKYGLNIHIFIYFADSSTDSRRLRALWLTGSKDPNQRLCQLTDKLPPRRRRGTHSKYI